MSTPTTTESTLTLSTDEAGRLLGISRTKVFDLLGSGELRSMKIGRRRRIPTAEVERFIADNTR